MLQILTIPVKSREKAVELIKTCYGDDVHITSSFKELPNGTCESLEVPATDSDLDIMWADVSETASTTQCRRIVAVCDEYDRWRVDAILFGDDTGDGRLYVVPVDIRW